MRSTLFTVALIPLISSWCRAAEGQAAPKTPLSTVVENSVEKPPLAVSPFDAARAKQHQETWAKYLDVPVELINSIGMKLVLIPAGEFLMGSSESEEGRYSNEHQHRVRITRPFYLGVYEVTQAEYENVTGRNPSYFSAKGEGKDDVTGLDTSGFPVETVSWNDAVEYCRKLSLLQEENQARRVYRLPTEVEWEYACRAGTTTAFHFGPSLPKTQATFLHVTSRDESFLEFESERIPFFGMFDEVEVERHPKCPTRVGFYRPNAFGLHDMHGNVLEWCHDWFKDDCYTTSHGVDDSAGPLAGSLRVIRGGSCNYEAGLCRSAIRRNSAPGLRFLYLGFRVALVPPGK